MVEVMINPKQAGLYAALIIVSGCSTVPPQVLLTIQEQKRLAWADYSMTERFTQKAQDCIRNGPNITVNELEPSEVLGGKKPSAHYDPNTQHRRLDEIMFREGSIEGASIHESIHQVIDCGLVDLRKFKSIYGRMESEKYPIKKEVESRVAHYKEGFYDLIEERVAYLGELWNLMGYKVSPEMEEFLSSFLTPDKKGEIMHGLIGKDTRRGKQETFPRGWKK